MLSSSERLSPLSDVVKVALEEEQTLQEHTPHTRADIRPRVHLCPLLVAPRPGGAGQGRLSLLLPISPRREMIGCGTESSAAANKGKVNF